MSARVFLDLREDGLWYALSTGSGTEASGVDPTVALIHLVESVEGHYQELVEDIRGDALERGERDG